MSSSAHSRRRRPDAKRGNSAVALLFWLVGFALLAAPFLRAPAAADPEGDDPVRATSERDIPFAEDLGYFEEDFDAGLGEAIATASEETFGVDALDARGMVQGWRIEPGKIAYEKYCIGCHGSIGDGAGPAAPLLDPRPRNFRHGIFKFTSTDNGLPPLRRDLFQTITRGLSGSSMPNFRLLSEETRWDLVEYVRYVALRGSFEQLMLDIAWEDEEIPDAEELAEIVLERWSADRLHVVYPEAPEIPRTPESIERGRELYLAQGEANCTTCHGDTGVGDGPSAGDFKDDWGYPIAPRDLTTGQFRAGSESADLYRSISTGITGTPMPSFSTLSPEDVWAIVHYIQSLSEGGAQ